MVEGTGTRQDKADFEVSYSRYGLTLRMLEIGALKPDNYASCSKWIHNSPMDLNSQHPDIEEGDFLQRHVPSADELRYDIVSCSLVLNFVPDAKDRGKWRVKARLM